MKRKRKNQNISRPIKVYTDRIPDNYSGSYKVAVVQKFNGEPMYVQLGTETSIDEAMDMINLYVDNFGGCNYGMIIPEYEEFPIEKRKESNIEKIVGGVGNFLFDLWTLFILIAFAFGIVMIICRMTGLDKYLPAILS